MINIKYCPFCGCELIGISYAKKRIWKNNINGKYVDAFRYFCKSCKATTDSYLSEEEARNAWNGRVSKV